MDSYVGGPSDDTSNSTFADCDDLRRRFLFVGSEVSATALDVGSDFRTGKARESQLHRVSTSR